MGLSAGLDFVMKKGQNAIHAREIALLTLLRDGLSELPHVTVYRATNLSNHVAVLTANIEGVHPGDAGAILDADFDIAVRTGLHCAPLVHTDLGTLHRGAIRFSLGVFNTEADIDQAIRAMAAIH
jgi:selenocysteine lyase/cysteine desulfurase